MPSAFDRYLGALADAAMPVADKAMEEHGDHISRTIAADIAGIDRPSPPEGSEPSEDEVFLSLLLADASEIEQSRQALLDADVYVRRFPYGDTRVTRVRHLRNAIGFFLHESYVMKERIKAHLNRIDKEYRSTRLRPYAEKMVEALKEALETSLQNVRNTRDSHVHEGELKTPALTRLESLEFLAERMDDVRAGGSLNRQYRDVRSEWRDRIREFNDDMEELLDIIFEPVCNLLIDDSGSLRYPSDHR